MKQRKREIAHAGTFMSNGVPVTITAKMLSDIAENFRAMHTAPVTLGHEINARTPRLGNVKSVELVGSSLFADIEENDKLNEAVNAGFFPDCSIGAKQDSNGKYYLHHLAYLGEEPPAIKDLKNTITEMVAASDTQTETLIFPSINLSDIGVDKMNELEQLKARIAELEKQNAELQKQNAASASTDTEELKKENAELTAKLKELTEKLDKVAAEHPEIELSDASPATRTLYENLRKTKRDVLLKAAEGKLSKAGIEKLALVSGSLSLSDSITLSDGKAKSSSFDLLTEVFETMPSLGYLQNEVTLSDGGASSQKETVSYSEAARLIGKAF